MTEPWSQFKVSFQWPKISEFDAAKIADAHNRDCAAYESQIAELQRKLEKVVEALKPAQIKWNKAAMDSPEYHAWCLIVPLYGAAVAIAEGRDNGN
jgi:hypothetical protein